MYWCRSSCVGGNEIIGSYFWFEVLGKFSVLIVLYWKIGYRYGFLL